MPAPDEAVGLAVEACAAAADKKATDPLVLEVADLLGLIDLFVVLTAANERRLKAVAEEIEHAVDEQRGRRPLRREGTASSGWLLLDYGDVVCHLFLPDRRHHYALERLWGDVPRRHAETGERLEALTGTSGRGA